MNFWSQNSLRQKIRNKNNKNKKNNQECGYIKIFDNFKEINLFSAKAIPLFHPFQPASFMVCNTTIPSYIATYCKIYDHMTHVILFLLASAAYHRHFPPIALQSNFPAWSNKLGEMMPAKPHIASQ